MVLSCNGSMYLHLYIQLCLLTILWDEHSALWIYIYFYTEKIKIWMNYHFVDIKTNVTRCSYNIKWHNHFSSTNLVKCQSSFDFQNSDMMLVGYHFTHDCRPNIVHLLWKQNAVVTWNEITPSQSVVSLIHCPKIRRDYIPHFVWIPGKVILLNIETAWVVTRNEIVTLIVRVLTWCPRSHTFFHMISYRSYFI